MGMKRSPPSPVYLPLTIVCTLLAVTVASAAPRVVTSCGCATPPPLSDAEALFSLAHGVNEFDLIYDGGLYHWVYTVYAVGFVATTHYRSAATVAGLESAADTIILSEPTHASTAVPTIQLIAGTWHVWAGSTTGGATPVRHYTASTPEGPYTLADSLPITQIGDPNVRYRVVDGLYYLAVTDAALSNWQVRLYQASSPSGPWIDLGAPASVVGRTGFDSVIQADPNIVFIGSRAFMLYAGYDGNITKVGGFELDTTTWKALTVGQVLVAATEPWQLINGAERVQDPIYMPQDDLIYFEVNAGYAGAWWDVPAGWGYIPPPSWLGP